MPGLGLGLGLGRGRGRGGGGAGAIVPSVLDVSLHVDVADPAEPSTPETVVITAIGIGSAIAVSALTGFEYSLDGVTYADTASIPAAGGTLYVRLKGGTADATLTGDIVLSNGDVSVTIPAYGTIGETILMLNATDWLMWDLTDDIKLCNGI